MKIRMKTADGTHALYNWCCENLHGNFFFLNLNFIIGFVACTCWQQQTKQQPTNVHPGRQPVLTSLNLRFRQNKQFKQPTKQIL